jgi:CBS domain-containing protein
MTARKATPQNEATVGSLMRRNFTSVDSLESLLQADRLMRLARIRHLPVVDAGRLVGLLSHRDVIEAAVLEPRRSVTVSEVMRAGPYTADAEMTLGAAARRMLRLRIGCLPVVRTGRDGEELIGLLTESDLLHAAYATGSDEGSG